MKKLGLHIIRLQVFLHRDYGATGAEYAIIASLIAAVIIGVVIVLGEKVLVLFQAVSFLGF